MKDLSKILELHRKWLEGKPTGRRADLREVDLSEVDLREADLRGAKLDYSCWPLWCGTCDSSIKVDKSTAAQLLYHACIIAQQHIDIPKTLVEFVAEHFYRYNALEKLK